jgi:hypothetical protein
MDLRAYKNICKILEEGRGVMDDNYDIVREDIEGLKARFKSKTASIDRFLTILDDPEKRLDVFNDVLIEYNKVCTAEFVEMILEDPYSPNWRTVMKNIALGLPAPPPPPPPSPPPAEATEGTAAET